MNKAVLGVLLVLLLAATPSLAATIEVGSHHLLPDTAGQLVEIWVTAEPGDPPVAGLNFRVQVANGGPEAEGLPFPGAPAVGEGIDGPAITAVDISSSEPVGGVGGPVRLFGQIDNLGNVGGPILSQIAEVSTIADEDAGNVMPDGLLGTITFDTTGFFQGDGPWSLCLGNTIADTTELLEDLPQQAPPIPLTIIEGELLIGVPEPATATMLLGLLAGVPILLRRRRHRL
ncbi:MAG: hypothetical protein JXB62_13090 [Pirellulales bacterium]|nr:hypothetical protein [Pirellulales bacterium]